MKVKVKRRSRVTAYLIDGRLQVINRTTKPDDLVCAAVWFVWKHMKMRERMVSTSHSVVITYDKRLRKGVSGLGVIGDGYARICIPRDDATYPVAGCDERLQGTPYEVDYSIQTWLDAVIAVVAHEFTHNLGVAGDDNLQGERTCEMAARDLVLLARAHPGFLKAANEEVVELTKIVDNSEIS